MLERVKGIEPSYEAWEAAVLPLNYTRSAASLAGRCRSATGPCRSIRQPRRPEHRSRLARTSIACAGSRQESTMKTTDEDADGTSRRDALQRVGVGIAAVP